MACVRSAEPLVFEEALHTYYAVADARRVSVAGLTGATYADKTRDFQRFTDAASPFSFAGPTDRVYTGTGATCTIDDPGLGRRIVVEKDASATTVVWNPWAGHKPMPDLGADEWPRFVCVETANAADDAVTLAAGTEHTMRASIRPTPSPTGSARPRSGAPASSGASIPRSSARSTASTSTSCARSPRATWSRAGARRACAGGTTPGCSTSPGRR